MLDKDQLIAAIPHALESVDLEGFGEKEQGKVRDIYRLGPDRRLLITTDRVSAFDRVLGTIPYKGQVLNQLAAWWFAQTRDIVANHLINVPDPNVMLVHEAEPLPVEVVVRGYITGVTDTSLWTLYEKGVERPYGLDLPPGLQKNDRLPEPVITPTTKAAHGEHDQRLTSDEVVEKGLVEADLWEEVKEKALALYRRGQYIAMRAGLILVDTKYEFGLIDGRLVLIDEIHTPDSSRFWVAATYEPSRKYGKEPENFDKEFLRKWFVIRGYRGEGEPPVMPPDFIAEVAARYIAAYEKITLEVFEPAELPAQERIARNLEKYR
ncbi:MAG: phosphoribosylaminoimidazolesuccinocarboxamide synthase [Caldilineae bacterium]|nr:MAG: phosphoribosylaminoimidazolesuccinocarboxamide synthase [Caldilineae bacterium]